MKKRGAEKPISPSYEHTPPFYTEGTESSARLPSDYSRPTLAIKGVEQFTSITQFEVQLTVRIKTIELTRKQLCLLAGICLNEVAHQGLNLSDWVILEFLYSQLLGNKTSPFERKDPKEFELSLLLKIVLLSGTWFGLETKKELPQDVQTLVLSSKWVPKKRTLFSWLQSYSLNSFIEVRAVPLNIAFERSNGTERYSSYCKGYGESSRKGRRQKTRPSAELDGDPVDIDGEQASKLDLLSIQRIFTANLLEIKYSQRKE